MLRIVLRPSIALALLFAAAIGMLRVFGLDRAYFASVRAFLTENCPPTGQCLLGVQPGERNESVLVDLAPLLPDYITSSPSSNWGDLYLHVGNQPYINYIETLLHDEDRTLELLWLETTLSYGELQLAFGEPHRQWIVFSRLYADFGTFYASSEICVGYGQRIILWDRRVTLLIGDPVIITAGEIWQPVESETIGFLLQTNPVPCGGGE